MSIINSLSRFIKYDILKKTEYIKWSDFFRIDNKETVTVQVIPNREIDNTGVESIIKALSDLYEPAVRRIEVNGISVTYRAKDHLTYNILFLNEYTGFYITVPESRKEYILGKIRAVWNKAAIRIIPKEGVKELFGFNNTNTVSCELRLKEHNLFSLKTDRRDNDPYTMLLPVSRDIAEGEKVLINIDMTYSNRADWMEVAKDAYETFRKGRMPKRTRLDGRLILYTILSLVEAAMYEVMDTMRMFWTGDEGSSKNDKVEREVREIQAHNGGRIFSEQSRRKLTGEVLETNITILSQSNDEARARQNLMTASGAYRSLDADNQLEKIVLSPLKQKKRIKAIEKGSSCGKRFDKNLLEVGELQKILSMPTAGLLRDFGHIEQIENRETDISPMVLDPTGIWIGESQYKKQTHNAYMPISNLDELCLPVCGIGGMGSGKTKGYASNTALESFRKGISCFIVDPAKGESCNIIRDALNKEELERCIDLDFNNVDWPISLHWLESIKYGNRLAGEALATMLMDFISDHTDDAGNRTRRYFRNAAKAIFTDPQNTILEIALLLESESYRGEMKKKLTGIARDAIEVLDSMSNSARTMIAEPILNRLDELMANGALKGCLAQRPKLDQDGNPLLDFRKFMDGISGVPFDKGAYMVLIRASKESLGGKEVRDTLLSYINSKIMLATLTRNNPDIEYRPAFVIYDEPHQYMSSVKVWEDLAVESRKYRVKFIFLFHSWQQLSKKSKDFVRAIKSALPHYIIYSTSNEELEAMKDIIEPYTIEEVAKIKTHHALIKLRAGNEYLNPFVCKMLAPPDMRMPVRDNKEHTLRCSKIYGDWWEDVEKDIYERERVLFSKSK